MSSASPGFDHERLDVYQTALDFLSFTHAILAQLPRGRGSLGPQLLDAALSISANIAEGSGEYAPREKVRFYRIALRSATESAAHLDAGERLRAVRTVQVRRGKELLHRIVAMLLALIRRIEAQAERAGPVPGHAVDGTRLRDPGPGPA